MPTVVNVRGVKPPNAPGILYVGRRCAGWKASPLANPFKPRDRPGEDCIELYRQWLWDRISEGDPAVLDALRAIEQDSKLGCWCHPAPCHAQVIIKAWEWLKARDFDPKRGRARTPRQA